MQGAGPAPVDAEKLPLRARNPNPSWCARKLVSKKFVEPLQKEIRKLCFLVGFSWRQTRPQW